MSFAKIRPRRGTATQWTTANPVLAEGELAIEVPTEGVGTGLVKIKIGDGATAWNELPYAVDGSIDVTDFVAQTLDGGETDKVPSVATVKSAIDKIGMYYDPETDKKYLLNQSGEWVEVGYGGLLTNYLYHLGDDFVDKTGGYESLAVTAASNRVSSARSPILSMESNNMYITWSGSISYSNGAVFNKTPIDITDINNLRLTLSASGTTNSVVQFIIASNNKSLLNILSSTDIRNGKTSVNDTFDIDVSSISGVVYYGVYFSVGDGGTVTNEVRVSSIWIE